MKYAENLQLHVKPYGLLKFHLMRLCLYRGHAGHPNRTAIVGSFEDSVESTVGVGAFYY